MVPVNKRAKMGASGALTDERVAKAPSPVAEGGEKKRGDRTRDSAPFTFYV